MNFLYGITTNMLPTGITTIFVLFALPCAFAHISPAHLTFTDKATLYDVVERQRVSFTCVPKGDHTVDIVVTINNPYVVLRLVEKSKFNEQYDGQYNYALIKTNKTTKVKLTLKTVWRRHTEYIYRCFNGGEIQEIALNVHRLSTDHPICRTNYLYTKGTDYPTRLQCIVETTNPDIYMSIYSGRKVYTPGFRMVNTTHKVQEVVINSNIDVENIVCTTTQYIRYAHTHYYHRHNHTCSFNTTQSLVGLTYILPFTSVELGPQAHNETPPPMKPGLIVVIVVIFRKYLC